MSTTSDTDAAHATDPTARVDGVDGVTRVDGSATHVRIAIAGSGFSGLGAAIRLKQDGHDDFVVLERARDVGGTWRDNSYPGCACDVPSHLYSFSFAPKPDWSRSFSPQSEIWAYLRDCARRFGVLPHLRYDSEVLSATWQEDRGHWRIETTRGTYTAEIFVAGSGALSDPAIPKLPGLETFEGTVFHSAEWNHDHDLTGRAVAVIGTGASAIQFVPQVAPQVGILQLFQRTPPWIMPRLDRRWSTLEKLAYRCLPGTQRLARSAIYWAREGMLDGFRHPQRMRSGEAIARWHMRRQVPDPELRIKITPNYKMGCKRILISNDYLPALCRDNVNVISERISEVRPRGIVTMEGSEHRCDTIIFGTGFQVTDQPIAHRIRGRDGRSLAEEWQGSPKAHLGTTVAGYPNLFLLLGPNTGIGHTSAVFMIEAQIEHVVTALRHLDSHGLATVEPSAEAQAAYVAQVDADMQGTVWLAGGCSSWYLDRTGRNSTLWPTYTTSFKRRVERFDAGEYVTTARATVGAGGADGDEGGRR